MEIYIKKHEQMHKIHWLNSLPCKYKDEIIDQILDCGVNLDHQKQYKIVVDILKKKEEGGEKAKEWSKYRKQANSPQNAGGRTPKVASPRVRPADSALPNDEQTDEQLAQFEGNQSIKKQLLSELMEDVNLKKAEKRRELANSRQSYSRQFSPARGGPAKRLQMAQAYSERMLNQYPQNQNKALPVRPDQLLVKQSGAGAGQISISDLHGLYQTIQNELLINLAQVRKLQSSPDAKNLKYQMEIDQTIANLTGQLAQIEHLIQRQKTIIQMQNEQIQQQLQTETGVAADLKVDMADNMLRDSKEEVATVLVRTVSQQAETQLSQYPQLQTRSSKALQALASPSQRGPTRMSASQHQASRLDTRSASEPKVGAVQADEEPDEYAQERVLSSNSATTTAKKGITPKYIDEEQIQAESSATATQKPGPGYPKKKQTAVTQSRIQSGKVKLKPRANQTVTKAEIGEPEAAQATVGQSGDLVGQESGPLPTSDPPQTSQSRSNKKSMGRQNIPASIVSVGDLDQFQSSHCTSADQKNQKVLGNQYSPAVASLEPFAEPALKIDSIIELEASETEKLQHMTQDHRASISTNAAKTNELPKVEENLEQEGSKQLSTLQARADTPSAVQINTLTKIKSAEFSSKPRVSKSGMVETNPNADSNQIEQIYEKYHQQMAEVASPKPLQGRFRPSRAAGSRVKMISSEERIDSPISQRQHSQQKFITFNYIGSVKNSFGILKTSVPIRDKYQSYIDRAVNNYEREKQYSNLNHVNGTDSGVEMRSSNVATGEEGEGNMQGSNASLSKVNRANYFTGGPQTNSGTGIASSQGEFGYFRSNHEPYAKNKRQFKARKLQAGQKPKLMMKESEIQFMERYRDYQEVKNQEQREVNIRTSFQQASTGSYDAGMPHRLEPKPLPVELVQGINSTTSTGRSQNPWLDGKEAGFAKGQSTIQMAQKSELASPQAVTADSKPQGAPNNVTSGRALKDKSKQPRGGRGRGMARGSSGLVIDPVLGPCIQGHGLKTPSAMYYQHDPSQDMRVPLTVNQLANSPQMNTRTSNLLLAHKRAGIQSAKKSKKATPGMIAKRFVKNQELLTRHSKPSRPESKADLANSGQAYSIKAAEQAQMASDSPFPPVPVPQRAITSASGASGIHLGADGGKGTLLLPVGQEHQGAQPQQSHAFAGSRKLSNKSQGPNNTYERNLYGTTKNIQSKEFEELQPNYEQMDVMDDQQDKEERKFIKVHDSSGKLSVKRQSKKANAAVVDSNGKMSKKKNSPAKDGTSGERHGTLQRPQSSHQERVPKLLNCENAMRQSQKQNQLTEMLAFGPKKDSRMAKVGLENQNEMLSGIQTEELVQTLTPGEAAQAPAGKDRTSVEPPADIQPEASPTKFMKKAYSLKIGATNDFELQSKITNHMGRRYDANYLTGAGFKDKTRNNMVDVVTVNSFQNIEIQKNLSQKSAVGSRGFLERGPGSPQLDIAEQIYQAQGVDDENTQQEAPADAAAQPEHQLSNVHALLGARSAAKLASQTKPSETEASGVGGPATMQEALHLDGAGTGGQGGFLSSDLQTPSRTAGKPPLSTKVSHPDQMDPHYNILKPDQPQKQHELTSEPQHNHYSAPIAQSQPQAQDQNEIYLRFLRFKLQKKQKEEAAQEKVKQRKNRSSARRGLKTAQQGAALLQSRQRNSSQAASRSKSKLVARSVANLNYPFVGIPEMHTSKYDHQRVVDNQMFTRYKQ